jgi:hypothetical protein
LTGITRFLHKPEFGYVSICIVELVLNERWFEEERAREVIDQIFLAHVNGTSKLSLEFWNDFCNLLWNTSITLFESKQFEKSLAWFE